MFMNKRIRKLIRETFSEIKNSGKVTLSLDIPLTDDIMEISKVFEDNEFKLFLVGGAVRDAVFAHVHNIKGKIPKDYDFATDALPDQVEDIMKTAGLKTLPTGKAFGVINVFTKTGEYEIATFRTDIGGGRRPDSVEFTTIDKDVLRRDLTINGLFYDINKHEVIDLVGGISDLKNRVIKAIGDASDRFKEDKLRILRALRFAARFNTIPSKKTDAAIKADNSPISANGIELSANRIRDEFLKGIKTAVSTVHFLKLIDEYDLWFWIFPSLSIDKSFAEEKDHVVLIANLLKGNDLIKIDKILRKMTFTVNKGKDTNSVKEIPKIKFLISFLDFDISEVRDFKDSQLRADVSEDQIRKFSKLTNLDSKIVDTFIDFNNTVTGQELIDLGFSGRGIRDEQDRLEANNFKTFLRK